MVADKEQVAQSRQQAENEEKERVKKIDFKMVTFTLAGKDYGIDIMNVKEISKANHFTYVPNSAPFVMGVHNLRGEIISIIDLRLLFNLPVEERQGNEMENILILRIEGNLVGVIVDSIDKVVGIDSDYIQPPHPLFGDINIKYIRGVVDNEDRLYIILDADRIFTEEDEEELKAEAQEVFENQLPGGVGEIAQESAKMKTPDAAPQKAPPKKEEESDNKKMMELKFIEEGLQSFMNFNVTPINRTWIHQRYDSWVKERNKDNIQLQNKEDAAKYLTGFYSPDTAQLWKKPTLDAVAKAIPKKESGGFNVWNPGCGKGYESYSLVHLIKEKNPGVRLKIYSNDNDLLAISNAPSLTFNKSEVPEVYTKEMTEAKSGLQFSSKIKDLVMFEYHDVAHTNPYGNLDLVVARDLLSFLKPENQVKFTKDLKEKMKQGGIIILGNNEILPDGEGWKSLEIDGISAFQKT